MAVSIAVSVMVLVGIAGALFDDRQLLGHPIWMKPLKFSISFAAYCATLAWMLSLQTKARRLGWWMGTVVAAGLALELVLIVGQVVVRGRQLHFNMSTPMDERIHNGQHPPSSRPPTRPAGCTTSAPTRSAPRTAAPAYRSPAGTPRAET
jgi:hypothetical protein